MKLKVLAVLCCALALCFALVGCGGIDKSKFVGDWQMKSSTVADLDSDTMELARSLGLDITLTLNEDGTGTFVKLSDSQSVTWEAKSSTEGRLILSDTNEAKITVDESSLTLTDGSDQTLNFSRT